MFFCDKCGLCCMSIGLSDTYHSFDRGDGICRYFDDRSNLCSIYENRPLLCNVDEMYDRFFKEKLSREEYYNLNHNICKQLKKERTGRK